MRSTAPGGLPGGPTATAKKYRMSWDRGGAWAGAAAGPMGAPQKKPMGPKVRASWPHSKQRHDSSSLSGSCVTGGGTPGGTGPRAAAARLRHLDKWLLALRSRRDRTSPLWHQRLANVDRDLVV